MVFNDQYTFQSISNSKLTLQDTKERVIKGQRSVKTEVKFGDWLPGPGGQK